MIRIAPISSLRPRGPYTVSGRVAVPQGEGLQHARQPQPVVGVEVGDEDGVELGQPDRAQQLALGAFAAVEQQAVPPALDERSPGGPGGRWGPSRAVPAKKIDRSMASTVASGWPARSGRGGGPRPPRVTAGRRAPATEAGRPSGGGPGELPGGQLDARTGVTTDQWPNGAALHPPEPEPQRFHRRGREPDGREQVAPAAADDEVSADPAASKPGGGRFEHDGGERSQHETRRPAPAWWVDPSVAVGDLGVHRRGLPRRGGASERSPRSARERSSLSLWRNERSSGAVVVAQAPVAGATGCGALRRRPRHRPSPTGSYTASSANRRGLGRHVQRASPGAFDARRARRVTCYERRACPLRGAARSAHHDNGRARKGDHQNQANRHDGSHTQIVPLPRAGRRNRTTYLIEGALSLNSSSWALVS